MTEGAGSGWLAQEINDNTKTNAIGKRYFFILIFSARKYHLCR
jgi:hypothetical protein